MLEMHGDGSGSDVMMLRGRRAEIELGIGAKSGVEVEDGGGRSGRQGWSGGGRRPVQRTTLPTLAATLRPSATPRRSGLFRRLSDLRRRTGSARHRPGSIRRRCSRMVFAQSICCHLRIFRRRGTSWTGYFGLLLRRLLLVDIPSNLHVHCAPFPGCGLAGGGGSGRLRGLKGR